MNNQKEDSNRPSTSRGRTLTWIVGLLIGVLLGASVAWLGSHDSTSIRGVPVFSAIIGFAFILNWIVFIPSYLCHTEKFFDLTGAVTYVTATLGALLFANGLDLRALLVGGMVIVWAVRLGSFLFLRIHRDGSDSRFDQMKYDFWQFLMTWTIQGLWVSLTASAALLVITSESKVEFGFLGVVGSVIWLIGFAIEVIADWQKSQFKSNPANQGKFITTGLWAWSRHPNYFGEIVLWTGIAIMAVPLLERWSWFVLISPVFVYFLLTRISGIPIQKKRADERWGHLPEYQAYIEKTPVLVPRPPR